MTTALQLLEQNKDKLAEVLPANLDPNRMARLAVSCFRKNADLQKCTPASFVSAVMDAAQLGLEPGLLNEASLVPYGNECTLIVGYKGLMKCAMRSGEVSSIFAAVVKEGDEFVEELGSDPRLVHKPIRKPGAKITHYYALAKMKNGDPMWEVMSVAEIEDHKKKHAKGTNRPQSAWNTSFDAMAKKTVVRQLCKMLPMSVELQGAFDQEKKSVETWKQEVARPQKRIEIEAASDIPTESDLEVEKQTLRGHLDVAENNKIDISDIVMDRSSLLLSKDAGFLRAVNEQLDERLEVL